jgi:hypothetical protein
MVNYTVSSDIRRALSGPGFFIAAAGMALAVAVASLQGIFSAANTGAAFPAGFHAQTVLEAMKSDWVTLALPVLCTLPFASSFVDDVKSGYIKQFLHRTSTARYIGGKLAACAVSGGLALFAGVVLAYGLSCLVFAPMELAPEPGGAAQPYFAELLMKAAVFFFSGAFWSLMGFAVAALTMSRYMAYASPFVLYYVLIILHERYFENFYALYPKEWLDPSKAWPLGAWGVILLLCELMAAAGLAFALAAKRRLADG